MFEPDAEAMPPDQRGQLQLARLRALVDRLLSLDGVQAGRLRAAGIQAGSDVTTLADLPRLPTTGKKRPVGHLPVWDAGRATRGGRGRPRVKRHGRPPDAGLLHAG